LRTCTIGDVETAAAGPLGLGSPSPVEHEAAKKIKNTVGPIFHNIDPCRAPMAIPLLLV
jgi:hypothetical protein